MRAESPQLASAVTAESPRVEDIRRVAQRLKATIVEYLVTARRVTAWVVSPSGRIRAMVLPILPRDLGKLGEVRAQIEGTYRLADSAETHRQLKALHSALVAPISAWLPTSPASPVVVVPHGPLAFVPFAALEDPSGSPLIERHTLVYVPSLAVSSLLARAIVPRGTDAFIVADPPPPPTVDLPRLPRLAKKAVEWRHTCVH